jgi:hypothetical protein
MQPQFPNRSATGNEGLMNLCSGADIVRLEARETNKLVSQKKVKRE